MAKRHIQENLQRMCIIKQNLNLKNRLFWECLKALTATENNQIVSFELFVCLSILKVCLKKRGLNGGLTSNETFSKNIRRQKIEILILMEKRKGSYRRRNKVDHVLLYTYRLNVEMPQIYALRFIL